MRQPVTSREYKIMMRSARFAGSADSLRAAAHVLWRKVYKQVRRVVVSADGELERIKTQRLITFLDSSPHDLHGASYILRERRDNDNGERQLTLKFRHPDRYLAQDRDMGATGAQNARTKFEEDIKASFVTLYSFSTTLGVSNERRFRDLGDVARVFSDLPQRVDGFRKNRAIGVVNNFTARELVLVGGRFQIGRTPRIDAECALIVWYDEAGRRDRPVAVELSYRYGDQNGEYGGPPSQRAFAAFHLLQTELPEWVDPKPRTKTTFVYQNART
jgi:hypothetical protein